MQLFKKNQKKKKFVVHVIRNENKQKRDESSALTGKMSRGSACHIKPEFPPDNSLLPSVSVRSFLPWVWSVRVFLSVRRQEPLSVSLLSSLSSLWQQETSGPLSRLTQLDDEEWQVPTEPSEQEEETVGLWVRMCVCVWINSYCLCVKIYKDIILTKAIDFDEVSPGKQFTFPGSSGPVTPTITARKE